MGKNQKCRTRLRIRIGKPFTTDQPFLTATVEGREVTITPQSSEDKLTDAKWIVLTAGGFGSDKEAQRFGEQLRGIIEVAALCARLGADVGQDRATSCVSEQFARSIGMIQPHERIVPNVHGLMVIPDDDLTRFPIINAEGKVTIDPAQFVSAITELGEQNRLPGSHLMEGIRLLNLALMSQEPLAQVVLALSAVEALGQNENWTERQRALLNDLANQLDCQAQGDVEQQEVAEALRRHIYRISLRQGVIRVLSQLELEHLKHEWDRVYGLRSGVFHGTSFLTDTEVQQLAHDTINLCANIILAAVKKDGLFIPTVTNKKFSV